MHALILSLLASAVLAAPATPPAFILFWTIDPWHVPMLDWFKANDTRCVASTNHADLARADLVFISWTAPAYELPPLPRPRGVTWAYYSYESPSFPVFR